MQRWIEYNPTKIKPQWKTVELTLATFFFAIFLGRQKGLSFLNTLQELCSGDKTDSG